MLQCYNRGCGEKYDPAENKDDSCTHHPGEPFFHDAYKGWSCCKKKSVDFTEFLSIKGCTKSKHCNEKPVEPEKPKAEVEVEETPVVERQPIKTALPRPPFNSPMTTIKPEVMSSLKNAVDALLAKPLSETQDIKKDGEVPVGTSCKNGGCNYAYQSPECDDLPCQYHPGFPIFHEGMKYWSCCQRKTSDFNAFLSQKGCETGSHKWFKESNDNKVECRYDWHQTSKNVHLAIYAKLYHYDLSSVKVNPIRATVSLVFPAQDNARFDLDLELRGIIKPEETTVKMYGTKVELTMPKAEASSWAKLDFPRAKQEEKKPAEEPVQNNDDEDSDTNLDDIEPVRSGASVFNLS